MEFTEVDRIQTSQGLLVVIDTDTPNLAYGVIVAAQWPNIAWQYGRTSLNPDYVMCQFGLKTIADAIKKGDELLDDLYAIERKERDR